MRRGIYLAALLLVGCSDDAPQRWSRSEIEDIADDAATGGSSDLEARVSQLETELAQLRRDYAATAGDVSTLAKLDVEESQDTQKEFDRLDYNDDVTRRSINEVRSRMGMPTHAVER